VPLKTTSVRLDDETLEQIGHMADAMDRPRAWLMAHAIKQYVKQEEWFIQEVEKGMPGADEGQLKDHAAVKDTWESRRANKVD